MASSLWATSPKANNYTMLIQRVPKIGEKIKTNTVLYNIPFMPSTLDISSYLKRIN